MSPLRGENPIFGPLSKMKIPAWLRYAGLPVIRLVNIVKLDLFFYVKACLRVDGKHRNICKFL